MLLLSTVDGVVAWGGVLALLAVNATLAAIATRFYRIRFATRWATVIYTAVTLPLLYVATTVVVLGVVGLGTDVTVPRDVVLVYAWALPAAFGVAFEVFWMGPAEPPRDGEAGGRRDGAAD